MVKFDELPVEIQEKMLEHQIAQGNPRNPDVFRKDIFTGKLSQGMSWSVTPEGEEFWSMVTNGHFDVFFQKYPKKEFSLPKNWHVVVTEENQKEVSEWRFKTSEKICLGFIAGVVYNIQQDRYGKGHNPGDLIKKPNYDFGTEITTEQFRKYVLKEDTKTYPRIMEVSNFEDFSNSATRVVFMEKNGKYITWGGARTLEEAEKTLNTSYWAYAREVAPIVELTVEDISAGKGVGVDPKLIRFKE